MKNIIKFFTLFFILGLLAYSMSGCAATKIAITPNASGIDKSVQVSDEDFNYWKKIAQDGKDSIERSRGTFWAGQYYYNKKNYSDALKYFEFNEKYYSDTDMGYLSVVRLFDINIENNEIEKGLDRLKLLLEKRHQFSVFQDVAIDRLKTTMASIKKEDLKNIYAKHIYQTIDEYAIYYLCKIDYAENNIDEFYFNANIFLIDFRDSLFYQEITDNYKAALKYKPLKANKIGVIIPLTGKSMDIGSLVKNGFDIAMDDYNATNKTGMTLNLIYIDEESADLKAEVISAIETQGVIAFMGPLYSKTVKTLIPIMDKYNTVLFSSTAGQPDLTGKSSYFFRNCGTAKGQAYSTAKYIMENTSFRNIATLYSDNAYGKILNDSFVEKIKSHGGNLVKQVVYDPKVNDFQEQMVLLGGINTILLKEKHATEKMKLDEQMESAGKKMLAKVYDYMNIIPPNDNAIPKPTPDPKIKTINICLVHLSPHGENVRRLLIDEDMTNKLSYTLAKSSASEVIKQKSVDDAMVSMGVDAEDLDRETALNIASKQGADVLIWGKIVEEKSNTIYANFMPDVVTDATGNTSIVYNFTEDDYLKFSITLQTISVKDEALLDELTLDYRKIKEPKKNPITIDALYIPATDRKMVLIKDQLKFYDFDLPVFGSSAMSSGYIDNFKENVEGIIYPLEFYPDDIELAVSDFVKKYKDKYANTPEVIAATSYDALKIVGSILNRQITSRENFRNAMASIKNYPGATGMFSFDSNGDSVKEYYMMQAGKENQVFLKKVTGE